MSNNAGNASVADLLGPWIDPQFDSGLIHRCKKAWSKPLNKLTNEELATFLRQDIATVHILPLAKERISDCVMDDTEIYDGELKAAVESLEANFKPDL
jgi:hypothetical protein